MTEKPLGGRMVRIYLTESSHQLQTILQLLHDQHKVRGVTAFRGISGFGQSGKLHSSTLLDISLNLPVILEFFDSEDKIAQIINELQSHLKPGHLVSWPVDITF